MKDRSQDGSVSGMSRCLLKTFLIVLVGSGFGLTYNAFSSKGLPLYTPQDIPPSDAIQWELFLEGIRVTLAEAKQAFDGRSAVFIDSRSSSAYAKGHIQGAFHIPASQPIAPAKKVLANLPKDTVLITYCSGGGCRSSLGLARLLIKEFKFSNTRVFHGGWSAWSAAGYPVTVGAMP